MDDSQLEALEALLSQQLEPLVQLTQKQATEIEDLKRQLAMVGDTVDHLASQKSRPPMPISEAWALLGFPTEQALRKSIVRGNYTLARKEIIRTGGRILVNVDRCLENGYKPNHLRHRSA